ncbi:MAG TPA: YcnI family protein [Plantibacter sp.]|uniref:YcnI family copper-binding membrane protein n=1 Tax=unclassified Plantibacter TaxID=2624265 RepID=UPI002CABB810|nr:YcnI family protein [Plantibacter sp.]
MNATTTRPAFRKPALLGAVAIGAGALLAIGAPLAASAHVSVTPTSTAAGSYTVLSFAVGHGCDGSPTTSLSFEIPESINAVTPTINPNWDVTKTMTPLADPITDSHGEQLAERVGSVVYTAKTPLADGYRDTVSFQVQLPADAAGETLVFPVTQTCEVGQTDWTDVAKDGQTEDDLEAPAPVVVVTAAEAGDHHGAAATDEDADHTEAAASSAGTTDVLGRVLGIAGLVVGAAGIVIAASARRAAADAKRQA